MCRCLFSRLSFSLRALAGSSLFTSFSQSCAAQLLTIFFSSIQSHPLCIPREFVLDWGYALVVYAWMDSVVISDDL